MKPALIVIKGIAFLVAGYMLLSGIEWLAGYLWLDSYHVWTYETAVDHFLILRIFILCKAILICCCAGYILLRFLPRRYWKVVIAGCIFSLPLLYLIGFLKYRCDHVYEYLKSPDTTYEGKIFEYDPMLGKRAIKNTKGYQDYWIKTGNDYRKRIAIDSLGFRVAEKKYTIADSSLLFFLGCSFTWGDGCIAEETYPYLLGSTLHELYMNTGQSAYGLGQMTLLAEKLIPLHRPKYVFVQYSPWLIGRSLSPFKGTIFTADITFPYVVSEKGTLTLKEPLFESGLFRFDSEGYRLSPSSVMNRFRFYYDYGVGVLWHDLVRKYRYLAKNAMNKNTTPAAADTAQSFLYQRIFAVAHRYGCQVYVVNIGGVTDSLPVPAGLFEHEQVINADSALRATAHHDVRTYQNLYYHWAMDGKDSVIADVHPNAYAHSIIATEIRRHIADSANVMRK